MTRRILRSIVAAAAVASMAAVTAAGQTASWTPSRLPDGQLDIRGHWISDAVGGAHSVEDGRDPDADVIQGRVDERNPILIVEPADGRIPYQPAAAARRQQLLRDIFTPTRREHIDPHIRALLDGVPRNNYVPGEMQILQVTGAVVILYESNHSYRIIPLDGRPHPPAQVKLWMGDSRGRWEGNTLVVDVTNFNEETWFDSHGSFHSDALHVVERWTPAGPGSPRLFGDARGPEDVHASLENGVRGQPQPREELRDLGGLAARRGGRRRTHPHRRPEGEDGRRHGDP
jgi:hypothetical protein